MHKLFVLLLAITGITNVFSQQEIMKVIQKVREEKSPEIAKDYCTNGFWVAKTDGGERTFKKISKLDEGVSLKVSDTKLETERAVLVVDFLYEGKKSDEVYLFLVKKKNKWLLDGFNEAKGLIYPFLDGSVRGHFSPLDLPTHDKLQTIGEKILSFGKDKEAVVNYCKKVFAPDSDLSFSNQLTSDDYVSVNLKATGYHEQLKKGFIFFEQKHAKDSYTSEITLFVSKKSDGKFLIHTVFYVRPFVSGFFEEGS